MTQKQRASTAGFTLTELLVLIGLGSMLAGLLMADLAQTKAKLLQQACAANLKQWGMAIELYSQDYNGTFYYDVGGVHFDDIGSPYGRYLISTNSNPIAAMRRMRICPSVAASLSQTQIEGPNRYSYSMPIGTYRKGAIYANADAPGSPFYVNLSYYPNLRSVPNPSKVLLLIDSSGHTIHCGGLVNAVSTVLSGDADQVPAINRHGGAVNCLFGDSHVELISSQVISNQDSISCSVPPGNPWFALN